MPASSPKPNRAGTMIAPDPTRSPGNRTTGEVHVPGRYHELAHCVSTIVDLPRILVLDGGPITADGRLAPLRRTRSQGDGPASGKWWPK